MCRTRRTPEKAWVVSMRLLLTVLLTAFVTLKLVGVVDWPWLWVLAPFWIPAATAAILMLLLGVIVYLEHRSEDERTEAPPQA